MEIAISAHRLTQEASVSEVDPTTEANPLPGPTFFDHPGGQLVQKIRGLLQLLLGEGAEYLLQHLIRGRFILGQEGAAFRGERELHSPPVGGGFCPALSQGVWIWGNTDDVLFRLIALGSAELQKRGWTRYQYGTVKAPMPEMGHVIKTSDHLWQIVSFIRSINPPGTNPPEKVIPGKYTAPTGETKAE